MSKETSNIESFKFDRKIIAKDHFDNDYVHFIESRNMHQLPSHCTGCMFAMKCKEVCNENLWILGITIYIEYYETESLCFTKLIYDTVTRSVIMENKLQKISLKRIAKFIWLNQIDDKINNVTIHSIKYTNPIDNSIQMNTDGPDIMKIKQEIIIQSNLKNIFSYKIQRKTTNLPNLLKDYNSIQMEVPKVIRNNMRYRGFPNWAIYDINGGIQNLKQMKIFCINHSSRKQVDKVLFVPYLNSVGKFAAIKYTNITKLINTLNGKCKIHEKHIFDEYLCQFEEYHICQHLIDERCYINGVRFILVERKDIDNKMIDVINKKFDNQIQDKNKSIEHGVSPYSFDKSDNNENGVSPFVFKSSDGIISYTGTSECMPHNNNGLMLSVWFRSSSLHKHDVTVKDISLIRKAYGNVGFGSRSRSSCIGTNIYIGRRDKNTRTKASPIDGPLTHYTNQYFRNTYNSLYVPYVEALTNTLSSLAIMHQRFVDRIMFNVLPNGKERTFLKSCRVKIITMGQNSKSIGFANELHVDRCDSMSKEVSKRILHNVNQARKSNKNEVKRICNYLSTWSERLFFTKATTCAYQMLEDESDAFPVEYIQYFILRGLGCCVRFGSHTCHMFYAAHFSHCTAVCVMIKDSTIYLSHNGIYNVFAWGAG